MYKKRRKTLKRCPSGNEDGITRGHFAWWPFSPFVCFTQKQRKILTTDRIFAGTSEIQTFSFYFHLESVVVCLFLRDTDPILSKVSLRGFIFWCQEEELRPMTHYKTEDWKLFDWIKSLIGLEFPFVCVPIYRLSAPIANHISSLLLFCTGVWSLSFQTMTWLSVWTSQMSIGYHFNLQSSFETDPFPLFPFDRNTTEISKVPSPANQFSLWSPPV